MKYETKRVFLDGVEVMPDKIEGLVLGHAQDEKSGFRMDGDGNWHYVEILLTVSNTESREG